MLQAAFRGDVVLKGSPEDFQLIGSKEYGASYALLEIAIQLELVQPMEKTPPCGNCAAQKVRSMSKSIVIDPWTACWSARAPFNGL